jgi:hypothetical protein
MTSFTVETPIERMLRDLTRSIRRLPALDQSSYSESGPVDDGTG